MKPRADPPRRTGFLWNSFKGIWQEKTATNIRRQFSLKPLRDWETSTARHNGTAVSIPNSLPFLAHLYHAEQHVSAALGHMP